GAVLFFYYAGHGLQLGWRNYLVPTDLQLASAADVRARAVDVQQILDSFGRAGSLVSIFVLDACRNNPFSTDAQTRGLAPMDAPPNTFLAYATAPGRLAVDGDPLSTNGPYARYLIAELRRERVKIEDVFKRVRLQVRKESGGYQIPWESTSLEDDVYLDGPVPSAANSVEAKLAAVSSELAAELDSWNRVKTSNRTDDYYEYLMRYPSGLISEVAQFRLDRLQKPATDAVAQPAGLSSASGAATADPSKPVSLASGADRYRVGDRLVYDRTEFINTKRRTLEVVAIEGERVVFGADGEVRDQMGSILENRFGVKSPGIVFIPSDLSLGKRWRTAFTNTNPRYGASLNYWDSRVVALEDVTVPAGTFRAYRIERVGQARYPKQITDLLGTTWVDPATMLEVKHIGRFSVGGRVTESWTDELVTLTQVPR
ncbi:MAG: caspase domain-containing protein, partial [Pseudorhodoplanes sp.]